MDGRYVLLTFAIIVAQVICQCPHGWVADNFKNSCFFLQVNTRKNWVDAATDCAGRHHSHLAYIHSVEEHNFLVTHLRPHIDDDEGSDKLTSVWIGGTDDQEEGQWVWYGTDEPIIEYTNWYPGEPDTGDGDHEEDCICIVGNHGYTWQDHNCKENMFYVCQIPFHGGPSVG